MSFSNLWLPQLKPAATKDPVVLDYQPQAFVLLVLVCARYTQQLR